MSNFSYANTLSTKLHVTQTPQSEPLPGREVEMEKNNAGGFTFTLDVWGILDRFLILGTSTPTYYASANKLTKDAFPKILDAIKLDGVRVVNRIVEISLSGRAPKNDPAIVALALAAVHGNPLTVDAAYAALPKVARIGTHLFQFVDMLNSVGKWNAAAKRGISRWYNGRTIEKLSVQLLKYQQRDGWSHRDVLRLAHVKPRDEETSRLFKYVTGNFTGDVAELPLLIGAFESLKADPTKKNAIKIIEKFGADFTWEMLPTQLIRDKDVAMALLPNMGITAILRKLGQLSSVGVLNNLSEGSKIVIQKLTNRELLKNGRVHPITILNALHQYSAGGGFRGSLSWSVNGSISSALDSSFYDSFNFIETTGKNFFLGVDCSGSMFGSSVVGTPNLNSAEVAAVMALAVAKREPNYWIGGFSTTMKELKIRPNMSLSEVMNVMRRFNWGGTDCSQPMLYAAAQNMSGVDTFVTFTDNETWAGKFHASEALARYRKKYNKQSKLIVCATSTTEFTIADPKDPGMLDIVGFDSSAPQLIQSF